VDDHAEEDLEEIQVLEISGQFNSQDVANTLWAYATIWRKLGTG
jgi:hypothetical protein